MIDNCEHPKDKQTLIVTEAFASYEVTRIKCNVCDQFISPAKTTVV